jgi:lipopolysaccharide/colanic/teichoic acid biosynthesis glycosyltransferase
MFQRLLALFFFIFSLPLIVVLYVLVKHDSKGPFFFKQKRAGKNMKPFVMYKIRTMVENAHHLRSKIQHLNEADGPVFKIRNDPRFTKIGKVLSYLGVDELPQLINIIKGEMALVGPRPLPIEEAIKVPLTYQKRFSVLPGMTSTWLINGAHQLSFKKWMRLDCKYIECRTWKIDFKIFCLTLWMIIKGIWKKIIDDRI